MPVIPVLKSSESVSKNPLDVFYRLNVADFLATKILNSTSPE